MLFPPSPPPASLPTPPLLLPAPLLPPLPPLLLVLPLLFEAAPLDEDEEPAFPLLLTPPLLDWLAEPSPPPMSTRAAEPLQPTEPGQHKTLATPTQARLDFFIPILRKRSPENLQGAPPQARCRREHATGRAELSVAKRTRGRSVDAEALIESITAAERIGGISFATGSMRSVGRITDRCEASRSLG